jgi:predicted glycoside hydrolase/deacetylase ChbG (UPF0249 family)
MSPDSLRLRRPPDPVVVDDISVVHEPDPVRPSPPLLIVNADDWGLTEGISAGILRAHRHGIVTSTSVLALGPAYPKIRSWLLDAPRLGVGVHLAAVGEDPPLLEATEIPTLVDRRGRLPRSWQTFVRRSVAGLVDPADLEREFGAQFQAVAETGIPITHLDAHQHLHLLPSVRQVVLEMARQSGGLAVRVPRFRARRPTAVGVTVLAARLAAHAGRAGVRYPHDACGIEVAGRMDLPRLHATLGRLAAGGAHTVELTVHPGEADDPGRARYRWNYRWEGELAALMDPAARQTVTHHGFTLGTYADLEPSGR